MLQKSNSISTCEYSAGSLGGWFFRKETLSLGQERATGFWLDGVLNNDEGGRRDDLGGDMALQLSAEIGERNKSNSGQVKEKFSLSHLNVTRNIYLENN